MRTTDQTVEVADDADGAEDETEAAEALSISVATLKRDWDFARTWLASQMR